MMPTLNKVIIEIIIDNTKIYIFAYMCIVQFALYICIINYLTDDDKCESCAEILEELETIDDDTDKHGIQFVKSNDAKLAAEIGVFSFPALVYYETGVPIMYDGKCRKALFLLFTTLPLLYDTCFLWKENKKKIEHFMLYAFFLY